MKMRLSLAGVLFFVCFVIGASQTVKSTLPFTIDENYFKGVRKPDTTVYAYKKNRKSRGPVGPFFEQSRPLSIKIKKPKDGEIEPGKPYYSDKQKDEMVKVFYEALKKKVVDHDFFKGDSAWEETIIKTLKIFPELINVSFLPDGTIPEHLYTEDYTGHRKYQGETPLMIALKNQTDYWNPFLLLVRDQSLFIDWDAEGAEGRSISELALEQPAPNGLFRARLLLINSAYFAALFSNRRLACQVLKKVYLNNEFSVWAARMLVWTKMVPEGRMCCPNEVFDYACFYEDMIDQFAWVAKKSENGNILKSDILRQERALWKMTAALEKHRARVHFSCFEFPGGGLRWAKPREFISYFIRKICRTVELNKREPLSPARFFALTPMELWVILAPLMALGHPWRKEFEEFHSWQFPGRGEEKRTLPAWLWVLHKVTTPKNHPTFSDCSVKVWC